MQRYAIQFQNKTVSLMEGQTERTLFLLFSSSLFLSCVMYFFFVGATTLNIINRNTLEKENRMLNSRVGELELLYLSETSKIDLNLAYSLGCKDATKTAFAGAGGTKENLSLAKNRQ